jgi:Zn-dependent metalloprotease
MNRAFPGFLAALPIVAGLIGGQLAAQTETQLAKISELKQLDKNLLVRWNKKTGVPIRLKGKLSGKMQGDARTIARQYFKTNAPLFRLTDPDRELRVLSVKKGAGNREHVRLQQEFKGIPVEGKAAVVHIAADRTVEEVRTDYLPIAALETDPAVTSVQAISSARTQLKPTKGFRADPSAALVVYQFEGTVYLCWKVRLQSEAPLGDFIYFVDAKTGKIIDWYNNLQTGCYRKAYDANHGDGLPGTLRRSEGDPPTGDRCLDSAYVHLGATCTFFLNNFGRDSYDDQGDTIRIVVHYQSSYNNAFWDGHQLVFGDGDGVQFAPLCLSMDVAAHEFTHGITEYAVPPGGLVYRYQSGALNESYSDIFGALLDPPDWMIGEDVFTPATLGDALRYMDDPTRAGDPDHMDRYVATTSDNGGVHTNSGIPNKAAFLMASGGTHHGITVPSMGRLNMGMVFYEAYNYLVPLSDFHDAREATLSAVQSVFPGDMMKETTVNRAWRAVGITALEVRLSPSDQLHPKENGGLDSVVATVTAHDIAIAGVPVEFESENTGVATVSTPSALTDAQGKVKVYVTGHTRGDTPLRVVAVNGIDSAFASVPVRVPLGLAPALLPILLSLGVTGIKQFRKVTSL